jgi:SsrA-binding protein
MAAASSNSSSGSRILVTNRKARRDFLVLKDIECGIELCGTEVKSVRAAKASLGESFAEIRNGEVLLQSLRIEPYSHGNQFNHDPVRPKRLLLHRREINQLIGLVSEKGMTLIPLELYLRRGRVKVKLGLCKGKTGLDKRETLKRRTAEREAQRAISEHMGR